MEEKAKKKNILLFLVGIAAAGLMHVSDKGVLTLLVKYGAGHPELSGTPYFSTLGFCINLSIYVFLLLCWINSLRRRLLPTRARTYLICAALMMILYLALRSAKYRFAEGNDSFLRYLWYLYYVPLIFAPTLFLMTCLFMWKKHSARGFDERYLLLPAAALSLTVLTNDLHELVFRFPYDWLMIGSQGTYVRNVAFYLIYALIVLCFVTGLILLTRINRAERSVKKLLTPFGFILLCGVLLLMERVFGYYSTPRPFNPPEIVVFCMLGILENCVRSRLIPHNENYVGFYRSMRLPAVITDRRFVPVYATALPVSAAPEQLAAALDAPVQLDADTRLLGGRLSAGYAFYTLDDSELHRLNEQLTEANELLSSENELIRAENELKERLAHVESRHRIYSRVSEALYRKRTQLAELLDRCADESADVRAVLSRACLLTAYIKRAGSLLLAEDGGGTLPMQTLALAFEESARYLPYCGVTPLVSGFERGSISREGAFALYSAFEDVCEAVIGDATMLTASAEDGVLRISADCSAAPSLHTDGVCVQVQESEGLYFISIRCAKGGAV